MQKLYVILGTVTFLWNQLPAALPVIETFQALLTSVWARRIAAKDSVNFCSLPKSSYQRE